MLKHIEKKYDYCIINCPAHYSELVVNALYVTDDVIIPFRSDANSLQAFEIVRKTIDGNFIKEKMFHMICETSFLYNCF